MTFGQWFKKEYGVDGRDSLLKEQLRRAWNAAAAECLRAIQNADKRGGDASVPPK